MTSKQRAYLMSLASNLNPIFQVGKSSLTPELTAAIGESFNNNELIKIGVLKNCFDVDRLAGRSRRRSRTRRAAAGSVCADKPARCARKGGRDAVARRASLRGDRRDHGAYAQQRGFEAPPHQAETA